MKKLSCIAIIAVMTCCFFGCRNYAYNKLIRQMKPLAKTYLEEENITHYDSLKIDKIDTITELGYVKLMYELLENMEQSYQEQYREATQQDDRKKLDVLELYINEISRTKLDFYDLMDNGELASSGLLLFMISGSYQVDGQKNTILFFVNPDKKSLHILDPFGNNLLYRDN